MDSQLSTQVGHQSENAQNYAKHTEENLSSYLELISHQRWLIICVALLVSLCGVLYAYLATPQYESNLLVHVEEKGQREPKNILGEAGSMIDYKTPSAAEIELLRSRQVIARAVDRLKLYIEVKPKQLPVIGKVFSTLGAVNYFPALQSMGGYAWGTPRFGNAFLRARHLPFKIASQERDEWLTCMLLAMRDLNFTEATQDILLNGLFGTADWMRNSPG
jgi:hypothetical protein